MGNNPSVCLSPDKSKTVLVEPLNAGREAVNVTAVLHFRIAGRACVARTETDCWPGVT